MAAELEDLRARLAAVADELGDLALRRLQDAVEAGAERAPVEEKRLTRARRSVEKAIHLLTDAESEERAAREGQDVRWDEGS